MGEVELAERREQHVAPERQRRVDPEIGPAVELSVEKLRSESELRKARIPQTRGPRRVDKELPGLLGVLTAPLLHGSVEHIAANATSLLILGTLAGSVYPRATLWAVPLVWLGAGLGPWLLGDPGTHHLGASVEGQPLADPASERWHHHVRRTITMSSPCSLTSKGSSGRGGGPDTLRPFTS